MHSSNGQPPRVVITGIGAVTPLGLSMDETWNAVLAGRSGIDTVTRFDTSELNTRFAGELKGFDAKNYMDRKEARRLDPYIQYALVATEQALTDSQIDFSKETPTDIGVLIASGTGGLTSLLDNVHADGKARPAQSQPLSDSQYAGGQRGRQNRHHLWSARPQLFRGQRLRQRYGCHR